MIKFPPQTEFALLPSPFVSLSAFFFFSFFFFFLSFSLLSAASLFLVRFDDLLKKSFTPFFCVFLRILRRINYYY